MVARYTNPQVLSISEMYRKLAVQNDRMPAEKMRPKIITISPNPCPNNPQGRSTSKSLGTDAMCTKQSLTGCINQLVSGFPNKSIGDIIYSYKCTDALVCFPYFPHALYNYREQFEKIQFAAPTQNLVKPIDN